jgi:hypothetical protein
VRQNRRRPRKPVSRSGTGHRNVGAINQNRTPTATRCSTDEQIVGSGTGRMTSSAVDNALRSIRSASCVPGPGYAVSPFNARGPHRLGRLEAPMRRSWFLLALLLITPLQAAEPRFSGNAGLTAATTQASADQRFLLIAALRGAPQVASESVDGRFALVAAMAAPTAIAGTCGDSDALFSNGFEGP